MWKCKECGNTDLFVAIGAITVRAIVTGHEKFLKWEKPDFKGADTEVEECAKCGSQDIEDVEEARRKDE